METYELILNQLSLNYQSDYEIAKSVRREIISNQDNYRYFKIRMKKLCSIYQIKKGLETLVNLQFVERDKDYFSVNGNSYRLLEEIKELKNLDDEISWL